MARMNELHCTTLRNHDVEQSENYLYLPFIALLYFTSTCPSSKNTEWAGHGAKTLLSIRTAETHGRRTRPRSEYGSPAKPPGRRPRPRASISSPTRAAPVYKNGRYRGHFISVDESKHTGKCLAEEREAKDSAREAQNATERCCETTSRALRSLPFAVWHDVEV